MKSLIIHCPLCDRYKLDNERFTFMVCALSKSGVNARYYPVNSIEHLGSVLLAERPDIVFCADTCLWDRSSTSVNVHAFLERMGIPFIGSSSETLELVLSKSALKTRWRENHISTPDFFLVRKDHGAFARAKFPEKLGDFPYILKPDREGNSRGLDASSIVFDSSALAVKLTELLRLYPEILVEKFLGKADDLREFTVASIGNGENRLILPAEILLDKEKDLRLITTEDKDNHNTRAIPLTDPDLKRKLIQFASAAFAVAGVEDYSRCDILMANGQFYAIEINGQPMIPDAWFESCAAGAGLGPEQYIAAIFLAGIERNIRRGCPHLSIPDEMKRTLQEPFFQVAEE